MRIRELREAAGQCGGIGNAQDLVRAFDLQRQLHAVLRDVFAVTDQLNSNLVVQIRRFHDTCRYDLFALHICRYRII